MNKDIVDYNNSLEPPDKAIAELLSEVITKNLPETAENKVWHGHPVWFIEGNPIVGYAKRKDSMSLLFWSGQSFDEPKLKNEGSFKAAEMRFTSVTQVNIEDLVRWLKKSISIQWDYKNIVKRRGELERLV